MCTLLPHVPGPAEQRLPISFPGEMGRPRLERLSAEDEHILALERGVVAGHVCKVLVLDGSLDVDRLRREVERRLPAAPRLRQRLAVMPRGLGRPVWVMDPDFDVGRHVRAPRVPAPLDDGSLRVLAASSMQERLPRDRPLWRLDVVPLTDERTALLWRIHHCMADGFTAMRMGAACIWVEEGAQPAAPAADELRAAQSPTSLLAAAALDRCVAGAQEMRRLSGRLAAARHWRDGAAEIRAIGAGAWRELRPSRVVGGLDAPLGRRRAVSWRTFPLAALHDTAKRIHPAITLNDAVVTLVASGVAAWTAQQRRPTYALRVRIPVSLHDGDHPDAANRDSFIDVDVPLEGLDVVGRLRLVNSQTAARKAASDARRVDQLLRTMAALPLGSHLVALADGPEEFALCVSNVVGPRPRITVAGVPVTALHSVVEVAQHHDLRASVISCAGQLSISLCADADRVDPETVMSGIDTAWAQLRERAGVSSA